MYRLVLATINGEMRMAQKSKFRSAIAQISSDIFSNEIPLFINPTIIIDSFLSSRAPSFLYMYVRPVVVGIYLITGCDYVSSFFKQTKEKFMKCLLKNADYIFATYSSLLKFVSDSNGHKVFDYIEELYLRLIYNVYLHIILLIFQLFQHYIITPRACARDKVISHVVIVVSTKSPYLEVKAPKQLVSTVNQSHLAKNGLQCASIEGYSPQVSQIVPFASLRSHAYRQCPLNAHNHNKYYELVKVVNNASGIIILAIRRLECKAPIESECKILPSLDLVQRESVVCWLISPGQPRVYKPLDTTKQHFYSIAIYFPIHTKADL